MATTKTKSTEKAATTQTKPKGPTAAQKEMVRSGTAPDQKTADALVKAGLVSQTTTMWDGSVQLIPTPKGKKL